MLNITYIHNVPVFDKGKSRNVVNVLHRSIHIIMLFYVSFLLWLHKWYLFNYFYRNKFLSINFNFNKLAFMAT